jgi:putative solute:sodium symporter small subunit
MAGHWFTGAGLSKERSAQGTSKNPAFGARWRGRCVDGGRRGGPAAAGRRVRPLGAAANAGHDSGPMPSSEIPEPVPASGALRAARARHWRRTRALTLALLGVWFLVGFVVTWFARDLDFPFFGWPFSFWVAAQGGIVLFVVLLVVYARRMARLDRRLAVDAEAAGDEAPR